MFLGDDASVADVGRQVYAFLRAHGLSPAGAAGVVGNAQQESSLNPGDAGGGLFQDIGSRAPSGTGSLGHQLQSAYRELQGMPGLLSALKHASDPAAAAREFSQQFERPGTPMLSNRESYARSAAQRYAGVKGAEVPEGGSPGQLGVERTGAGGSGAVSALLAQALQQLQAPQPLALGSPAKPSFAAAPILPGGARSVPGLTPAPKDDSLKALLAAAQATQAQEPAPGGEPHVVMSGGEAAAGAGGYVNPLPGFSKGRTDQGVDYSARPGAPIRAIGDGHVLPVSANWYKGQPYVSYELTSGPRRGQVIFVAEQIIPHVSPGQRVHAGQTIGVYAPSGTGIETGFGTRTPGQTLAKATTGYREGEETRAGKQARGFLEGLGAR